MSLMVSLRAFHYVMIFNIEDLCELFNQIVIFSSCLNEW